MSKLILFDFKCNSCDHEFEDLVQPAVDLVSCPRCGWASSRLPSPGHIDPRLGLSNSFPTMADKWTRTRMQASHRADKGGRADGAPNLKMY